MTGAISQASVPTIDLGRFLAGNAADRRRTGRFVDAPYRETGFLAISNHGVARRVIDAAWRAAQEFFDRLLAEKLALMPPCRSDPRGYFPVAAEALSRSRGIEASPDPKESFSSGPLDCPAHARRSPHRDFFYGTNRWPQFPVGVRDAWIDYYHAMETLGAALMQLFAIALELPGNWFEAHHRRHLSALRALSYPATSVAQTGPQHRAGEHSDYGSVTILRPDPDVGGLELRLPSGKWSSAPDVGSGFLVNIGDLLARWTNDRWRSTLHRVVAPAARPDGHVLRRQSVAYFQNPDFDTEICAIPACVADGEQPRYAAVLSGRYLIDRFMSAG